MKPLAELKPVERDTLRTAADWVRKPSEELRLCAGTAAAALGAATPLGNIAWAVFGSGGSLAPPDLPAVPPPPGMTSQFARNAVRLAAALGPPAQPARTLRQFLIVGVALAMYQARQNQRWRGTPLAEVNGQILHLYQELGLLPAGQGEAQGGEDLWDYAKE
jgi:hypothetical protein